VVGIVLLSLVPVILEVVQHKNESGARDEMRDDVD
jgi:hypothetical protein